MTISKSTFQDGRTSYIEGAVGLNTQRFKRRAFRLMTFCLSVFVCVVIASCATKGVVIENTPSHSLNLIRYVINQALPLGIRSTSSNGREYYSNYFSPTSGFSEEATDKRERAYAHIVVLGDRRPYRTDVRVYRERKTSSGYDRSGLDKDLARQLALKINEGLAKSRDERNIIDDFRPF